MELLLQRLETIFGFLEQIEGITMNQTTVLLQPREGTQEENEVLEVLESMVEYKEELTNQLLGEEAKFEEEYIPYKGKITEESLVKAFQDRVGKILEKKQAIIEVEKNNVMIMQALTRNQTKATNIPKQPNQVTEAYKKQQTKT